MKKIRYMLLAAIAAFSMMSCGGDDDNPTPVPTPSKDGQVFYMNCDMPAGASEKTVTLTGLTSILTKKVQAVSDWLIITPVPYVSGTPKVTVSCTQNLLTTKRVQEVVFIATNDTLKLTITQAGSEMVEGTDTENPYDTPTDQAAYSRENGHVDQ